MMHKNGSRVMHKNGSRVKKKYENSRGNLKNPSSALLYGIALNLDPTVWPEDAMSIIDAICDMVDIDNFTPKTVLTTCRELSAALSSIDDDKKLHLRAIARSFEKWERDTKAKWCNRTNDKR